jgi:DNA-binding Xre family transcriptional regulator
MMTPEQLETLRTLPLGEAPNRLRMAFALTERRQSEAVAATGIISSNLSDIVNGKYTRITVETAGKLAEFFGCAIEDLFPRKAA